MITHISVLVVSLNVDMIMLMSAITGKTRKITIKIIQRMSPEPGAKSSIIGRF